MAETQITETSSIMTDLSAGPGAWAHKLAEPDTSGQYPDPEAIRQKRMAELEREIAGLKANLIECPDTNTAVTLNAMRQHQIKQFEAELSRLRNEQPPGWDSIVHELGECPTVSSPLPEPQDVRERASRLLHKLETCIIENDAGAPALGEAAFEAIVPALAQSDAQPVTEPGTPAELDELVMLTQEFKGYSLLALMQEAHRLRTAPPSPDASGLIEAAEWHEARAAEFGPLPKHSKTVTKAFQVIQQWHLDSAEALRSRAADRSAPRSDKGEAQ
jgi:hypothetical protein